MSARASRAGLVLLLRLLQLLQLQALSPEAEAERRCELRPRAGARAELRADCRIRTLDPEAACLALFNPDGVRELNVTCNEALSFESFLRTRYFERFSKFEGLSLRGCKILRVPQDAFENMRILKNLTISSHNSEWAPSKTLEIAPGSFNGLRELQYLELSDNNVRTLPEDVFCPLTNLQTLNLTKNRLRSSERLGFTADCGAGASVRALDLSRNELRALPETSGVSRLRRLQRLGLQHNDISEISGEAFAGLVSLRYLNLSDNKIETLPEGVFASSRELREVYLDNNLIFELAKGVFQRLEHLVTLDLSNNRLSSDHVDELTFLGLIRLVILKLPHNALTRIDGKTFKDLFFLQVLDLRNNSIGYVEDNAFLPLYNLHTLNLAENRLHTIDEHLFNGLFVLMKLNLNNNLLVDVDRMAFTNCSDLKELDLSSNQISRVPEALWELSFLKTLDLGENQISEFKNGSFKNLGQLTGLRLIDNHIGNLTKGMLWDLPNLQVLNLARNKIQNVERGTFDRNTQLEAIRLDANFIADLDGVFSTLVSLLWLNLSENHLIWFDYAFVPSNLKWLDIHGNFIEKLGNYYKIQDQIKIKTLDASHNRLLELTAMNIPNSVELLFVNNNFINSVQANTFLDKTNLTRVDMYANDLVRLESNGFRLTRVPEDRPLPEFYVGNNPFHCDCKMDWLIENGNDTRQRPRLMDLENVVCKLSHFRGVKHLPLTSIKSSDFLCKYETHCFALCTCCEYDACDCEMTCPQNCTCYHDQTWNTNVVDCSDQKVYEIPHGIPMDSTEVYLDGNEFKELKNHVFIGRKNMRVLFVNGSGVEHVQNRTFTSLDALQSLHLEDNRLTELKGYEFERLNLLRELYLQNNLIEYIGNMTFAPLAALETLRLDGNRLVSFPIWQLNVNANLREMSLGNNRWSCKCRFLQDFASFVADNALKLVDGVDVWCWNDEGKAPRKRELDLNGTACSDFYSGGSAIDGMFATAYLPMMVLTLCGFLTITLALVLVFVFRDPIRVWLFANYGIRLFSFGGGYEEREKLYDGYVCYSPKDEEFVIQAIASELENGSPPFQLCLHYRDLSHRGSPYAPASPAVLEAAEASKRVILVLTRNFLQTEWSRFEFRQALHEALKGRIFKLVLVEEGQIAPEAESDPDLRPYLKTGSRVRWGEKRFRERLRYAMPGPRKAAAHYRRNINTYTLDSSVRGPRDAKAGAEAPAAAGPERPHSDHIYSSIDSDYSTLERGARGWRPPPSVQAYLV